MSSFARLHPQQRPPAPRRLRLAPRTSKPQRGVLGVRAPLQRVTYGLTNLDDARALALRERQRAGSAQANL